jgi:hypothetical protein
MPVSSWGRIGLTRLALSTSRPSHVFPPGLTAGYGFDVKQFVIGAEVLADFHHGSTFYKDAGVDLKVGMPFNTIMPYARSGMTGPWPNRLRKYRSTLLSHERDQNFQRGISHSLEYGSVNFGFWTCL